MFDFWSIIHFGFWAFIGSSIAAVAEPPLWIHIVYVFVAGTIWEMFEYYGERKWPEKWSNRIESWSNHWVGDYISNISGVTFGWFVVAFYRGHI